MFSENLIRIIDVWIKCLDDYDMVQLRIKPSPTTWSVGQVYMHLIENTQWFIEQARIAASNNEHADERHSAAAAAMFRDNGFPERQLEGPPSNDATPQPHSKEQIGEGLAKLREYVIEVWQEISGSPFNGKTKHPGHQYFNSKEWFQFADMHMRHHLRQKEKLDNYIRLKNKGG